MDQLENLKPPDNVSPEEFQAWNNMMDTMVTFIKACTTLINTISEQAAKAETIQEAPLDEVAPLDKDIPLEESHAPDQTAPEEPTIKEKVCPRCKMKKPNKKEQPEPSGEETDSCKCGSKEALMDDMTEKLKSAHEEITQLQLEMARLQRMDASLRTGHHAGPNPAALYKEIMRECTTPSAAMRPPRGTPQYQMCFQTSSMPNQGPQPQRGGSVRPHEGRCPNMGKTVSPVDVRGYQDPKFSLNSYRGRGVPPVQYMPCEFIREPLGASPRGPCKKCASHSGP